MMDNERMKNIRSLLLRLNRELKEADSSGESVDFEFTKGELTIALNVFTSILVNIGVHNGTINIKNAEHIGNRFGELIKEYETSEK